jgi:osmotically inducible protein OsmC
MPTRTATARWDGPFKGGSGTMLFGGGTFDGTYSAGSRFEEEEGTNPEELIAAAHAGCFSMALALILGDAGHEPESIETEANVTISPAGDGFEIDRIELRTSGRVPGIDQAEFERLAGAAKDGCPVSKALAGVGEITVDAQLAS